MISNLAGRPERELKTKMRLIDAGKLLADENEAYMSAQLKVEDKINRLINEAVHKKIQMLMMETPAAYDVDKVIGLIEEKTSFCKGATKYGNKNSKQQELSYSTIMLYEIAGVIEDIIDIVKAGGVEHAD